MGHPAYHIHYTNSIIKFPPNLSYSGFRKTWKPLCRIHIESNTRSRRIHEACQIFPRIFILMMNLVMVTFDF